MSLGSVILLGDQGGDRRQVVRLERVPQPQQDPERAQRQHRREQVLIQRLVPFAVIKHRETTGGRG
jgi:hypothetical protein